MESAPRRGWIIARSRGFRFSGYPIVPLFARQRSKDIFLSEGRAQMLSGCKLDGVWTKI
jgi:hypothetical protein